MSKRNDRIYFRVIARHTFRSKTFDIGISDGAPNVGALGCTTSRRAARPAMVLHDGIVDQRQGLEVLIHEAIHACFDRKLSERDVTRAGKDIARFLWRFGFRQVAAKRPPAGRKGRK